MPRASKETQSQNVPPSSNTASPSRKHPRRLPAHLSVSLCYPAPGLTQTSPPVQHSEGSGANAQRWFDTSNNHPQISPFEFQDNEPPYFLPQNSSKSSIHTSDRKHALYPTHRSALLHPTTNGSSVDDFRSVIDDLTIENKRLKEKLRRYEKFNNPHLDNDKLFEVKIHALPSRKRKELENTLRAFASSLDESTDDNKPKASSYGTVAFPHLAHASASKHPSSSSTSNSRLVDSGYASMSNSGPKSTSILNEGLVEGKLPSQTKAGNQQNVQNYLHNIPKGLLPKHSPVLTERQKKKIVVQRLEQLFAGKQGAVIREDNQHAQQQEVSKSAARADQVADNSPTLPEGHREAHILPFKMEVDDSRPGKLPEEMSAETQTSRRNSDSSNESSPGCFSPHQRPTRPLDLDPDRAQIPSENVEYIRHLGLSTPQLASEDSTDSAANAEGWIYLNLLINMAQLHIINVTPDFVRTAVSEVSQKFQLSADGKQVRWRGGRKGTQLSSDSGNSSAKNDNDSTDANSKNRKRRKLDVGRFQPVPLKLHDPKVSGVSSKTAAFHYKPLFHHRSSSGEMSTDESGSSFDPEQRYDGTRQLPTGQHLWNTSSRLTSKEKQRHEEGPIIFYSGANFCTDLSRDREGLLIPVQATSIEKDGYRNKSAEPIGCEQKPIAPNLSRTDSGSLFPFRPFKDYSKDPSFLESRAKTPEPLTSELEHDWFVNDLPKRRSSWKPLQGFEASGLGGTQPADHFALRVETVQMIATNNSHSSPSKLSKFSAPGPNSRRFRHKIAQSSLKTFHDQTTEDTIAARLAALRTFSPPPTPSQSSPTDPRIKIEILSTKVLKLQPSQLPPPLGYYTSYNSSSISGSESESDSDSLEISDVRQDRPYLRPTLTDSDIPWNVRNQVSSEGDDDESEEGKNGEVEESSVDMLAQFRDLDPKTVHEREESFEMEMEEDAAPVVRSSIATVNEESDLASMDGEVGQ